jgi:methionine synthase II (cobalamin-independent)
LGLDTTDSLVKELEEKEQECEELKNFHINLVGVKECEIKELLKLKQTLVEIKDIAEEVYNDEQTKFQASGVCYEILQKINEVEE